MSIEVQSLANRHRWLGRRIGDFAIYLAIALVVGFGIVWFAFNAHDTKDESIARWGGLVLNTAILYGYVAKQSRPFWHAWGFWLAIILVLAIHLLTFAIVFQHIAHWSVLWFLVMYPVEIPLLSIVCDWTVHITGGRPKY